MKTVRPTTSEAIMDLVTRNHPVYQCLRMGLINYHALVSMIKPTVDRITQRDVSVKAKRLVYQTLQLEYGIKKNEVILKMREFHDAMEDMFGSAATLVIEKKLLDAVRHGASH